MRFDTFKVPRRFKGETTILKIFKKKSLIYTLVSGLMGFIVFKILEAKDFLFTSVVALVLFAAIGYALGTIKIPEDNFNAGGEYLDIYIFRAIRHEFKKAVYTDMKGYRGNASK